MAQNTKYLLWSLDKDGLYEEIMEYDRRTMLKLGLDNSPGKLIDDGVERS